jgi:pSer/pThr/pTyr-binding forkhead associated (FHA) protein
MLAEIYVLNGRDVGKVLDANTTPVIFLGRAASNTLRIRDPQASRVHCRIDVTTQGLTLTDNKSGNGTFVNGERLEAPHSLVDGDTIGLGGTQIRILLETEEDVRLLAARRGQSEQGSQVLETSSSESAPVSESVSSEGAVISPADLPGDGERNKLREVIPGFTLKRRLGGHSRQGIAVYRAIQISLDRLVALKVFLPRGQTSQTDVDRFLREAQAVARLPHPNIVTIHDLISQGKLRAIVMEFLAGGSLADQLDDGPLDLKGLMRLGFAITRALAYLHSHGVVHRGVRPSNLLVAREHQTYKLANFATATGLQGERYGDTSFLDSPMEGFAYLAPEQLGLDSAGVDPRADVYGVGACLLAAARGEPPFSGASVSVLAAAILRDTPPEPPDWVPPTLQGLLAKCLAKNPADRYPEGMTLLRALQAVRG